MNKMTRKDTILIAVVINAGLLSVLFATAMIYDTDKEIVGSDFIAASSETPQIIPQVTAGTNEFVAMGGDEVDNMLKNYQTSHLQVIETDSDIEFVPAEFAVSGQDVEPVLEKTDIQTPAINHSGYIDIRVKKGDVLEKIARANGTTVSEIKRLNQLQSERLSIGQSLKIPVAKQKETAAVLSLKSQAVPKIENDPQATYYTIKSGDNPWKIAKQFGVTTDDILRLNQLNEEKARNMKAGERIRVK